ncbi:class I SAM-dependent methyltransferase [Streptomyces sp. NPDC093221]|uniref:class I SAM-dependent methyltransferase n=1 Tax=Streptomyces sp. NPDC093221 TaxID=3366032 RepID=UPI0038006006
MKRAYDDERLARSYESGNEMPDDALRAWVGLIGSYVDRPAPDVLEVGSGTGMFAAAMARWIDGASVLGVDASEAMLSEARRHHPHPSVRYAHGTAEALPAGDDAFDLALLSRVIHHFPDRTAAARELARVLRPGGSVVVRTTFKERLDAVVYDYWPPLRATDALRFPAEDDVTAEFTAAGFDLREIRSFVQPVTRSLRDYHARMTTQPQSKFALLTPTQFASGLDRLAAAADREPYDEPAPVDERYDVAVFTLR